ncbi:MAG: hypothetical protein PHG13_00220 [Candidatus Pacebacteria bacterium]|jgi:hypothetical protein|nr:hypothetical protein [Candidatus Paceibacterota bacterium]MDD5721650.1 hypothetical protein [Candidatus Paceibacterota bacterium]
MKINSKQIWLIVAIILIIVIGIVVWQSTKDRVGTEIPGISESSEMPSETSHEDSGASSEASSGGIGAMTDDVYVEIVAQLSYYMQTDPLNLLSHHEDLYRKYGVTEDNFSAYTDLLMEDMEHYMELTERIIQREQELLDN